MLRVLLIAAVAVLAFLAAGPLSAASTDTAKTDGKLKRKAKNAGKEAKGEVEHLGGLAAKGAQNVGDTLKGAADAIGEKIGAKKKKKKSKKK